MTIANGIFGREKEFTAIAERIAKRHSFLLHGPAGVGKTTLIRALLPQSFGILYCPDSSGKQVVFRAIAVALAERNGTAARALGGAEGVRTKSAVSLKGIVQDQLCSGNYWVVLDHLHMPSQAFAADVKQIVGWAMTPVLAIARSDHMEDVGFLMPLFSDRSDKFELRNFDTVKAEQFARRVVDVAGLSASNTDEFLARVLELSRGNPGAIVAMVEMAKLPKYRTGSQIMISLLYVDFRMDGPHSGSK